MKASPSVVLAGRKRELIFYSFYGLGSQDVTHIDLWIVLGRRASSMAVFLRVCLLPRESPRMAGSTLLSFHKGQADPPLGLTINSELTS